MFPIPPFLYKWLAIGGVILLLGAAVWIQTGRLDTCKTEHAAFVAQVKAVGDAQEAAAKIKDAQNVTRMETANAENARTRAALTTALNGLRHSNPRGVTVPAAAASSKRPALACYSRPELVGAVGSFVEAVRGLADEGSAGAVDLNTAKIWAQSK